MRRLFLLAILVLDACSKPAKAPDPEIKPQGSGTSTAPVAGSGSDLNAAEAVMFSKSREYEEFMGRWSTLLAKPHAELAKVKDGDRILDVGAGTGALAVELEKLFPASQIVGVDPSQGFIDYAKTRTTSGRVKFEVGDAQKLTYRDGEFDRTMAQLVMNFIPDHEKAIAEMRRVTKKGGTVTACVWDYDAGMQSLRWFWDEVIALDPKMEPKDERHMKLSRKGQLGELWRKAGLSNVEEKPIVIEQRYSSFDDYWGPFLKGAGPGGAYVVSLTPEARETLAAKLRARVLKGKPDGPFVLEARTWCVRGES